MQYVLYEDPLGRGVFIIITEYVNLESKTNKRMNLIPRTLSNITISR